MIASRALLRSVAVVRFRIWLATALAFGALVAGLLCAQVNEEKRRDQSEETEAHSASTPKPKKSPTPKAKRHHTPTPKPKTAKKKSDAKKSAKSKSAQNEETPKPRKTPTPQVEEEHAASEPAAPPPRAIAVPTPAPSPQPKPARAGSAGGQAQVVIEKSGIEEDQGFEPPPSPPPRRGFWPWSRPVTLPLPNKFGSRSDPARASETASLAVHCRAQQRHAAGQCACVRLLPQARSPHAERSRLSLRYRERHINRQRPSRSRRSMAASDKRRSCAQRLFEQHLARHLSRRRFQSRPADARTARRM